MLWIVRILLLPERDTGSYHGYLEIWFKRPKPHMDALKELYTMASTDVPVEQRQMAKEKPSSSSSDSFQPV